MNERHIVVVGGGAAGIFAAIACAESSPTARISVYESTPSLLGKVRISGGGRCNVTHACFDPRELSAHYPRGGTALLGAFHVFQPSDTIAWFEARGVPLKTEEDGRIFPASDSSQTIIDCLLEAARSTGVKLVVRQGVVKVRRTERGTFELVTSEGSTVACDRLMLATGGCRSESAAALATSLGHTLEPPVPSLFTFRLTDSWVAELAGVSLEEVEVSIPDLKLRDRGALLLTHAGLSGPVILRLSAWGARQFHRVDYHFLLRINWLPQWSDDALSGQLQTLRAAHPARLIVNTPLPPLVGRLWSRLVELAGMTGPIRWAQFSRSAQHRLIQQLRGTGLHAAGKSLNKDEFVTCGGIRLGEVNFKTMESRLCPGLFFGGELLDIDGLTGGFNFQAAWTTGWIAGRSMNQPRSGSAV